MNQKHKYHVEHMFEEEQIQELNESLDYITNWMLKHRLLLRLTTALFIVLAVFNHYVELISNIGLFIAYGAIVLTLEFWMGVAVGVCNYFGVELIRGVHEPIRF